MRLLKGGTLSEPAVPAREPLGRKKLQPSTDGLSRARWPSPGRSRRAGLSAGDGTAYLTCSIRPPGLPAHYLPRLGGYAGCRLAGSPRPFLQGVYNVPSCQVGSPTGLTHRQLRQWFYKTWKLGDFELVNSHS
jgi:hypothetical protein